MLVSNMGNDWPALVASNPGAYDAFKDSPNYISAHNTAWYEATGAANVGDLFDLFGTESTNESDTQAYYADGFKTYLYFVKVEDGDIHSDWGKAPADANGSVTILRTSYGSFTLSDGKLTVNDTTLRYQYFLVLKATDNGGYSVSQVGNNLVPNNSSFPYTINMTENDLLVAFFYNTSNTANAALYEIYLAALNGDAIYNTAVNAGGFVNATVVGGQLRFTVNEEPDESTEEPSEETSEVLSEETSEETSAETSAETSTDTSETEPADTGDAGFAALGILAVLSLAGVMIVRKKK